MAEYIDREAVRLAYENSLMSNRHKTEEAGAIHYQEHRHILHILERVPAADVVEVVRCEDCVRRRDEMTDCGLYVCTAWVHPHCVRPDDFCSCGERREQK